MTYKFHYENILALQKLKELNVKLGKFPDDVTQAGKKALKEVIADLSAKNKDFKRVYDSIDSYLKLSVEWSDVGLRNFLNERG